MTQCRARRPHYHLGHAVWLLGMCLLTIAAAQVSRAQFALVNQTTKADRDQVYRQIAEEVIPLETKQRVLKKVIRLVQPTVVHIEAKKVTEGFAKHPIEEVGSGLIIEDDDRDYVLTNWHVIKHAPPANIAIKLADSRVIHPSQVWADRETDVAVMQIDASDLIAARLGDSSQVEIGDYVLVIGSPFGLSHSVTHGIISAKGRRDLKLGDNDVIYQDFLQTDASINPGNSGGPMLNLRGEVIGINTAIASDSGVSEGIGFSIPINAALFVARQLIHRGSVVRAFLGVTLDREFDAAQAKRIGLSRPAGALVKLVTPQSAADKAHVLAGDVILEYNGVLIEDDDHLVNQVKLTPTGKDVSLLLFRQGKTFRVTTKLGTETNISQNEVPSS